MRIGDLARQTGVSVRCLRHYEKNGLLPVRRLENRYRSFGPDAIERVRRIRLLLSTGFSLADMAALLPCLEDTFGGEICETARDRYRERLQTIDRQIGVLREVRTRILRILGPGRNI
jgi:DNA-binding transcriptional MerR regulator